MPEIARFYGIVIRMYFDDHEPPHFHAVYADAEAVVGIHPIRVLKGALPRRALSLVVEWAALHQPELLANWERLRANRPGRGVEPLR